VTIELRPEQEHIIQQQLASGHFKSANEVLTPALASLPYKPRSNSKAETCSWSLLHLGSDLS
jgi:Arc/MetJ-type ribon-helix-helix transcriptional regulator